MFGAQNPFGKSSPFGAQAQSPFGIPTFDQQPAVFGSPTGFSFASSAFGQAQPKANGTTVVKFSPRQDADTFKVDGETVTGRIFIHCITAMEEYESKCIEELRMEDYMVHRKGPPVGATPWPAGAGIFYYVG